MGEQNSLANVLKDSAIIVALISAVLYFWGFYSESLYFVRLGVPLEFLPERTVQYYLAFGAMIALFFYLPLILFLILAGLIVFNRATKEKLRVIRLHATLSFLVSLLLFTVLLHPITALVFHTSPKKAAAVTAISLNPESKITTKYDSLFFVTKKDSNFVFVDRLDSSASTFILNESEVKELVLLWK